MIKESGFRSKGMLHQNLGIHFKVVCFIQCKNHEWKGMGGREGRYLCWFLVILLARSWAFSLLYLTMNSCYSRFVLNVAFIISTKIA